MKQTPTQQLLAALALLGMPFSALADEDKKPATPTPAALPTAAMTVPAVAPATAPVPLAVIIPTPSGKAPPPSPTVHVVKDRETLSGIA